MGYGHLGVIPLPTTEDSYEQPQINNYPGLKKHTQSTTDCDHNKINLLVFGGSKFKDKDPN